MNFSTGKLVLALAALIGLGGCASIGAPLPPSLELPRAPSDLRVLRKGDKVTLTWSVPARTTDRQSVRYLGKTRICRTFGSASASPAGLETKAALCETPVGEAAPPADFTDAGKSSAKKLADAFTDTLPSAIEQANPAGFATYAVEVRNGAGRSAGISNRVRVSLVPTIPPFGGFAVRTEGQGVLITWQCPALANRRTDIKYLFRIYRRSESGSKETRIAEVDATDCVMGPGGLTALSSAASSGEASEGNMNPNSFLDQTFEWEKTYFYRGTVVSVVEAAGKAVAVEGDDTVELKVFAHDVFPPATPSGLQAVFSGPGQLPSIDLIWAPVTDADLDGYNVYRREDGGDEVRVNTELVKTPAFRDTAVVSGKTYSYSVSAVDARGNESARSEAAGERVP
jgi:hypothetical protein